MLRKHYTTKPQAPSIRWRMKEGHYFNLYANYIFCSPVQIPDRLGGLQHFYLQQSTMSYINDVYRILC